nr:histidine phosphatase family protein [Desulfuromonadales bacterium]
MPELSKRRLVLLRHASAEGRPAGMDDRDRRLTAKGRGELATTSRHLRALNFSPDRVIISDARRALETWDALSTTFEEEEKPIIEEALYLAPPATILSLVQTLGGDAQALLVIGHNPGLTSLAQSLAGQESDPTALAALSQGLAPSAFACLQGSLANWSDLTPRGARLVHCGDRPIR